MKNYQLKNIWHTESEAKKLSKPNDIITVLVEGEVYKERASTIWELNETK